MLNYIFPLFVIVISMFWLSFSCSVLFLFLLFFFFKLLTLLLHIAQSLNLSAGTAANVFYVAVGMFGFAAAIFGPVLERRGPSIVLFCSTTMVFLGHMVAAVGAWLK